MTGAKNDGRLTAVIALTEQQIIDQLTQRLADAHSDIEPALVAKVVYAQYARFEGLPIRDYVPLFVERNAAAELTKRTARVLSFEAET
ncbi:MULTISPECIES: three-helix bundle dimerization domain-containing protein [Mycolicibacterium]|uniref:three-helix bundle dimerization domain-containing protein n=1 Tax=Mycolicibacterium TaxID=1866885 RepID=UPI000A06494F|nr:MULTISPECIES: hypothetical protein [Mycolicibacterium]QZY48522.1 hypothetical protein K5L12_12980 [Mycolicibacterium austroafricanum]